MSRPRHKTDENYIAFSDVMTCLMVIFLFVAISYIMEVFTSTFVQEEIYNTINEQMVDELKAHNVQLDKDLSLKFFNNDISCKEGLFKRGNEKMTPCFMNTLDEIWPIYQNIIVRDTFLNFISEIRIEGHTDTVPPRDSPLSSYEYNLNLSSSRAQEVLKYIRNMPCYIDLEPNIQERLQFLMTANGMSYSRALNDSNDIVYLSEDKRINQDRSRRVEFRIITSNKKLIENLVKE